MSQDVVHECASPEEAARLLISVYGTKEYKVVGSNIVTKAAAPDQSRYLPHITRQYTDPGEQGPEPIEKPLTFTADTVSLVVGGKRTDFPLAAPARKDVYSAAPAGGNPTGFAPIQRGVGSDEDEEQEEERQDDEEIERRSSEQETSGQIIVPNMRPTIKTEPRRRQQGKADAATGGDERGDSSGVRSIPMPDARHTQLRMGAWENALANLLRQHFDRQERVVKAKLTGAKLRERWDNAIDKLPPVEEKADNPGASVKPPVGAKHVFDKSQWKDSLKADTLSMLQAIYNDLGEDASKGYGVEWDVGDDKNALATAVLVDNLLYIEDTTEKDIQAALDTAWQNRDKTPEMADQVGGVFDNARDNRAPLIAQQQTVSAGNGAIQTIGEQNPDQFSSKTWNTQGDERVREWHADADGQTVPMDQPFNVGPDQLMYPGDPNGELANTINCRCWSTLSPMTVTLWEPPGKPPDIDLTKAIFRTSVKYADLEVKDHDVSDEARDDRGRWTTGGGDSFQTPPGIEDLNYDASYDNPNSPRAQLQAETDKLYGKDWFHQESQDYMAGKPLMSAGELKAKVAKDVSAQLVTNTGHKWDDVLMKPWLTAAAQGKPWQVPVVSRDPSDGTINLSFAVPKVVDGTIDPTGQDGAFRGSDFARQETNTLHLTLKDGSKMDAELLGAGPEGMRTYNNDDRYLSARQTGGDFDNGYRGRTSVEIAQIAHADLTTQKYPIQPGQARVDSDTGRDMMREAAVSGIVHHWAESSNDSLAESLAMQEAVKQEFKIKDAAGWNRQEDADRPLMRSPDPTRTWLASGATQKDIDDLVPLYRDVARAMYDNTQKVLADKGIKQLLVYRGVGSEEDGTWGAGMENLDPEKWSKQPGEGGTTTVNLRPMSSWSVDEEQAENFAAGNYQGGDQKNAVMSAVVPASRVFSTALSGLGAKAESEVVVLGGKERVRVGSTDPYTDPWN